MNKTSQAKLNKHAHIGSHACYCMKECRDRINAHKIISPDLHAIKKEARAIKVYAANSPSPNILASSNINSDKQCPVNLFTTKSDMSFYGAFTCKIL